MLFLVSVFPSHLRLDFTQCQNRSAALWCRCICFLAFFFGSYDHHCNYERAYMIILYGGVYLALFCPPTRALWVAQVLFGHSLSTMRLHFFQRMRTVSRLALYKDFPEAGQGRVDDFRDLGSDLSTIPSDGH